MVVWLTIPALVSIGITVWQVQMSHWEPAGTFVADQDHHLIGAEQHPECLGLGILNCRLIVISSMSIATFALFLYFWCTVMIEFWKRKYNQILYNFGL